VLRVPAVAGVVRRPGRSGHGRGLPSDWGVSTPPSRFGCMNAPFPDQHGGRGGCFDGASILRS